MLITSDTNEDGENSYLILINLMRRSGSKKVSSAVDTKMSLWMLIKRDKELLNCNKFHWYIFNVYFSFYRIKYFKTADFFFQQLRHPI